MGKGLLPTPHSPFPIPHRLAIRHIAGAIAWRGIALLQRLEADALGLGALLAQPLSLVGFVFLIVARKEAPLRFAFAREDVSGDAVEEPAVVRNHQHAAGKLQ